MNYELALELTNAGFPHDISRESGEYIYKHKIPARYGYERAYAPTLEELIEACGEKRKQEYGTDKKFVLWFSGEIWCAGYFMYGDDSYIDDYPDRENGSTPKDAVARLWLALNNK